MKIETLAALLQQQYIHGTTLQLPEDNQLQSQDISRLIENYLQPQLEITGVQQQQQTLTRLIYTGQINLLNLHADVTAIFYLTDTVTDGTPQLTLAVSLPAGWTFGATFPPLKGQIIDSLAFTGPLFVLESFTTDGSNTYPGIGQGFNFSGLLQTADSPLFDPINWLLGTKLLLTGLLQNVSDPAHTAPTMLLTTPLDSSSLQIGSVTLFTQTQVVSEYLFLENEADAQPRHVDPTLKTSVSLLGTLQLGKTPADALTLSMTLSPDPNVLFFAITSASNLQSLSDLTGYAGGSALSNLIPAQFPLAQYFSLKSFALTIAPAFQKILNLSMEVALHNAAQNGESPTWTIIPNVVSLSEIAFSFFIIDPTSPQAGNISASIAATLDIAGTALVVSVSLPDVTLQAYLPPDETIPVDDVLKQFIGPEVSLPTTTLTVNALSLMVNPNDKTFALNALISEDWELVTFSPSAKLVLTSISLSINLSQTGFTGQFSGSLQFAGIDFMVAALKNDASSSAWIFAGQITSSFYVTEVIQALVPSFPSLPFLDSMEVKTLGASYHTGDRTFSLEAAIHWPCQIGSYTFTLDLAFSMTSMRPVPDGPVLYRGLIAGTFDFLGLRPGFIYAFDQQNQASTYTLQLDPFTVQYVKTPKDERLIINFGNTTVGALLAWVIKLADPGASAQLSAPWDALNSISLSNLSITLDFTKNSLEIDYPVSVDLGFIKINNFSLMYTRNYGQGQVQLQLGGQFLGQTYDKNTNPLAWDALNGQPPAVPGAGAKLLDLQYMGLGQHIELAEASRLDTMAKVIKAMEDTLVPLDDTAQNPLQQVGGLQFNSGSNWLIGADFVILDTFALSLIFNDPQLYGLLVRVSGPSAAVFQGLSFEILYRKLSEKLGLFHVELKLPDAMRHLEFGAVSVTLPIIDIDIYTNGNFRLDFGFPLSLKDFSRSFSLQAFPFIGYGGFYFALLSGATSTSVPVVLNGRFNPVIEFGFALTVGVGKTLTLGPLSAGISVAVLGMLEGVFGWFHPTDTTMPEATYYRVQGTIDLVGKIYGTVDFAIVKANLSLAVYASITLAIECYKPIIIRMSAGVTVEINVQILFITVHFSFSTTLTLTFAIGEASTPPWIVGPQVPLPRQLRAQRSPYSPGPAHMALASTAAWRRLKYTLPTTFNMVGRAINDPNNAPLVIYAAPAFSQALPSDLAIPASSTSPLQAPSEEKPVVTITMLLFVENAISPQAPTAKEARIPTARADEVPFNLLMIKLLRWAIAALENETTTVSALELASIHARLDDPALTARIFAYHNLTKFFVEANVTFQLQPRPITGQAALSGTFFPMFPELTMSDGTITPVSFWDTHEVTQDYIENLNVYFKQLQVEYENSVERDPQEARSKARKTILAGEDDPTSIAAFIFCSYFELLTKSVVQSAQDYLQAYTYLVDSTQAPELSLQDIADSFAQGTAEYLIRQGDTLASIAALTGSSEEMIEAQARRQQIDLAQPGSRLTVPVRVTAESIVIANQAQSGILNSGGTPPFTLNLAGVVYQVRDGDTLSQVASTLLVTSLDLLTENADVEALFVVGTTIAFGTLSYTGRTGDSRDSVALYFGVDKAQVEQQGDHYTISGVTHTVGRGFVIPYTSKEGDTLDTIITCYFTPPPLTPEQRASLAALIESWNPHIPDFTKLVPGTLLQIPYNETCRNLARYYYLGQDKDTQLSSLLPLVESLKLLPLTTLAAPTITYPVKSTDTLVGIAQQFNLTLQALTTTIALTKGIFLPEAEIQVPDVPAINIEDLCHGLKRSPLLNTAAGMASRFLLQGLRLPYPQDAGEMNTSWTPQTQLSTYPLYALTGQEYQVATPAAKDYTITLSRTREASWLHMPPASPVKDALLLPLQREEIEQIDEFARLRFQPNIQLLTRLPLYTYSLRRFALQNAKHWQAAALPTSSRLASTSQCAGEPTIWPLPDPLQAQIAHAHGYELLYRVAAGTYTSSGSGIQVSDLEHYLWATSVEILVQEIPAAGYDAAVLPNTYMLVGADEQGKQTLLAVLDYLTARGTDERAALFLLYQPDPSGANPQGLASDVLNTTGTYLLQTNLSTVGHSGNLPESLPLAVQTTAATPNSATLDDGLAFLSLLWEGSVVKSGGYYLNYVNSNGGSGLPGYLFAQSKSATLTLLIL
ncbi:MAG TPA: LysM peptidoglycan-binding domain-containing protein, partial [Ktedonobacteraceae bacterium]|nr:LysM peptidoglycan-binding domain-containing protein [Ktedonobacteraceae bacterium]